MRFHQWCLMVVVGFLGCTLLTWGITSWRDGCSIGLADAAKLNGVGLAALGALGGLGAMLLKLRIRGLWPLELLFLIPIPVFGSQFAAVVAYEAMSEAHARRHPAQPKAAAPTPAQRVPTAAAVGGLRVVPSAPAEGEAG